MHLYVPRASAVDANVRQREKIGHYILGSGHMIRPIAGRLVPVYGIAPAAASSLIALLITIAGAAKKQEVKRLTQKAEATEKRRMSPSQGHYCYRKPTVFNH
jgi:hypothetical protein